jgi:hypothetical protein
MEKGIFTKEELLEMAREVDQEIKKGGRKKHENTMDTGYPLDIALERFCLMEGCKELSKGVVCNNAHSSNLGCIGDSLYFLISEG